MVYFSAVVAWSQLELPFVAPVECSRFSVFDECPLCGAALFPEHAHYRCAECGWRDSCCD